MNEEELKKLNELKEHCLKASEFADPHGIEKYQMFEMLEHKINELEKERKHLIDLQKNMDKQYELLESVLDEIREYIEHEWFKRGQLGIIDKSFQEWELRKLLQILDKVQK